MIGLNMFIMSKYPSQFCFIYQMSNRSWFKSFFYIFLTDFQHVKYFIFQMAYITFESILFKCFATIFCHSEKNFFISSKCIVVQFSFDLIEALLNNNFTSPRQSHVSWQIHDMGSFMACRTVIIHSVLE